MTCAGRARRKWPRKSAGSARDEQLSGEKIGQQAGISEILWIWIAKFHHVLGLVDVEDLVRVKTPGQAPVQPPEAQTKPESDDAGERKRRRPSRCQDGPSVDVGQRARPRFNGNRHRKSRPVRRAMLAASIGAQQGWMGFDATKRFEANGPLGYASRR